MKPVISQILIAVISAVIVVVMSSLFLSDMLEPHLSMDIHQTANYPDAKIVVIEVDVENTGIKTAKNCLIQWWPYGYNMFSDRVIVWPRPMDFAFQRVLTVHFFHAYNETGIFNTSLIIKCDNYVSNEKIHPINVTGSQNIEPQRRGILSMLIEVGALP